MKNKYVSALVFLLAACSGNDSENIALTDEDKPDAVLVEIEAPIAKDDVYNIKENRILDITNLLENDSNTKNTNREIITTQLKGTLIENRDASLTYTPPKNLKGIDVFEYKLCANQDEEKCSTAKVTIQIGDSGTPVANDDIVNVNKNTTLTIESFTLTANDQLVDNATIKAIDNTNTKGNITLLANGDITYVPVNNELGKDSFVYSLCDDDEPNECSTATVEINILEALSFTLPTTLENYYKEAVFVSESDLLAKELKKVSTNKHTTILDYGDRHKFLYSIDEDPTKTENVVLMYTTESRDEREWQSGSNPHSTQTFNTEHVYPQSLFKGGETVRADLHHLRVCDAGVNTSRSNRKFVIGSGTTKRVNGGWYPGDEWKGDVARMIFYLNIRYGESITAVGDLSLLLQWNQEDPISVFENQRNNRIEEAQGNRNPFIDNPYLATLIWGGAPAEDKW